MKTTKVLTDAMERLHVSRKAKTAERLAEQSDLFGAGSNKALSKTELTAITESTAMSLGDPVEGKRRALIPVRHPNRDFFLCDMFDYALKDDGASMEAPIFALTTQKDLSTWSWKSKDGFRSIEVYPSVKGRATQHDKDLLIFVISQLTEGLNQGQPDAHQRTARFKVCDYLVATNKTASGDEYRRMRDALERLRGTSITTDIRTGGQRVQEGFGIIDSWSIIEKSPTDERMIAIEITLSKWLFNAVQANEVLTINRDYFRLRKPLARRLYEIARKHCGLQAMWVIGLDLLKEKCGSKAQLKEFRRAVREVIEDDTLPDYRIALDDSKDQILFYTKDSKKLINGVSKRNSKKTKLTPN